MFQLVSVRLAYETSLLPFLARRSHLRVVISSNLLIVIVDLFCVEKWDSEPWGIPPLGVLVVGLVYLVGSCLFLLNGSLELLDPDAIEAGLGHLIRQEIREELKQEQFSALAEQITFERCATVGLEFSPLDMNRGENAIIADETGTIVDIDLAKLTRFAAGLKATIQTSASGSRALLLKGLGSEVKSGSSVLGRVAAVDDNRRNGARLRKALRIRKGEL
jgi:hypothetical protein